MTYLNSIADLEKVYGTPGTASLTKVSDHITPQYRKWIAASPFCCLSTVGPEGADASPRGDPGSVAYELDPKTLAIPDRRGNYRMDSLRNIIRDGRVALMFLIPGSATVIRVNGTAKLSVESGLLARFSVNDQPPRSVIMVRIDEVYFQCARAVMRAGLWQSENWVDTGELPSIGEILAAQSKGEIDGNAYDAEWPERARNSLW